MSKWKWASAGVKDWPTKETLSNNVTYSVIWTGNTGFDDGDRENVELKDWSLSGLAYTSRHPEQAELSPAICNLDWLLKEEYFLYINGGCPGFDGRTPGVVLQVERQLLKLAHTFKCQK